MKVVSEEFPLKEDTLTARLFNASIAVSASIIIQVGDFSSHSRSTSAGPSSPQALPVSSGSRFWQLEHQKPSLRTTIASWTVNRASKTTIVLRLAGNACSFILDRAHHPCSLLRSPVSTIAIFRHATWANIILPAKLLSSQHHRFSERTYWTPRRGSRDHHPNGHRAGQRNIYRLNCFLPYPLIHLTPMRRRIGAYRDSP